MTETRLLTDHQEIRDWAAGRSGIPAIRDSAGLIGSDTPVLSIQFGQHAYEDDDDQGADRPEDFGKPRLVEWDEWFALFDQEGLGLVAGGTFPDSATNFTKSFTDSFWMDWRKSRNTSRTTELLFFVIDTVGGLIAGFPFVTAQPDLSHSER